MSISAKVCDCFFDVAIYCKTKDVVYEEFFNLCLHQRNRKISFMIMETHDDCFIVCCKDFLKATVKDLGLNKIKPLLLLDWFYSSGFDSDTEDNLFSCIKTNFD